MAVNFTRVRSKDSSINLTPLIDVLFQLLIFFMLTSTFLYPSVNMDLPKAKTGSGAKNIQRVIVSVTKDGQIFLNSKEISNEALPVELKAELEKSVDKAVYFRADKKVFYEKFFEVMQLSTKVGASHFHLIHEPEL